MSNILFFLRTPDAGCAGGLLVPAKHSRGVGRMTREAPPKPFGLSLSKPSLSLLQGEEKPFDKLRANG
jgi:hypothetical protein